MIIATTFLIASQSVLPAEVRPEPFVCERSERDAATGARLWCPSEIRGRVTQDLLVTMPIEGVGKGWALLKCDLGKGGTATACSLVDESQPGSSFGRWALRVQLQSIARSLDGDIPVAGDSYYGFARWEVQ